MSDLASVIFSCKATIPGVLLFMFATFLCARQSALSIHLPLRNKIGYSRKNIWFKGFLLIECLTRRFHELVASLISLLWSRSRKGRKLLAGAGTIIKFRYRLRLQVRHRNFIPSNYSPREHYVNQVMVNKRYCAV